MEHPALTELQMQILGALVEGYHARAGMKDRIRALNEWEIARRASISDVSYAEFFEHPSREVVLNALMALQRYGLASVWERGVKYDTFVPTAKGEALHAGPYIETSAPQGLGSVAEPSSPPAPATGADPVLERLDEIIRLLRSLDAKLGES